MLVRQDKTKAVGPYVLESDVWIKSLCNKAGTAQVA